VVRRITPRPGVKFFDGATDGMAVMSAARGCTTLVVVDACTTGAEPGTIFEVPPDVLAATSARFDTRFLRIGLHPGGGHAWMLDRAIGPQAAAAMVLFGAPVDGARAAEIGLAWACHPDDELIDQAIAFAARAATVPKELSAAAVATLREAPWQPDFDAAVATEITRQSWSLGQGWFRPR
jgi:enoyl-CoA hydratase